MTQDIFAQRIETAAQRLDALRGYAHAQAEPEAPLLQAIEELAIVLEELQVAQEELHQQNKELIAMRQAVEAERCRYQGLFDLAPDGYLVTDSHGVIEEANRAAMKLLNVKQGGLLGKPMILFVHPDDRRPFSHGIARLSRKKEWDRDEWEMQLAPKDRPSFPAAMTVTPIHDSEGSLLGLCWLVQDITASKRTEKRERLLVQIARDRRAVQGLATSLEQERETLQTIMENTHAQLAYLDPDFNFLRVNSAYSRGAGYSKKDLIGRNHFELFPNAENEAIFEGVRDIGQPVRYQARPFEHADQPERGVTYWDWTLVPVKDAQGVVQGLVLSLLDVTEAERARQQRERYLARLNQLVEITQQILAERTAGSMLQRVVEAARELTAAKVGVAGHVFEGRAFRLEAASQSDTVPACPPADTFSVQKGGVYFDLLAGQGSIRLTDEELQGHPAWWGLPEGHTPLRGLLGAGMVGGNGQPSGFVMISHKELGEFTAEDEALLVQLAALASLGLQHIEARSDAEQRAEELSAVFGAMSDGVIVFNADDVAVRANSAAARIYGLDPAEFGSATMFSTLSPRQSDQPSAQADALARIQKLDFRYPDGRLVTVDELPSIRSLRGEHVIDEPYRLTNAEGEEKTVLISAAPLVTGGQLSGAVVVWHDVTERERARQEVERLAARDQAILSSMTEGLVVFDLEGNILSMNPAALRMHEFERIEEAQHHLLEYPDLFDVRDLDGRPMPVGAWPLARVLRGERFAGFEVQVRRTDTGRTWIGSYSGTCVRDREDRQILGILTIRDVTVQRAVEAERERLLDELDAERARLEAIINNAPEAIVVTDPSSRIVLANPATEQLYGRPIPSGEGFTREAGLALYHPDGTPSEPDDLPLSRSALDGETHTNLEMAVHRPDGERRDLLVSTAPIRDSRGRIDGVVGVFQDITERKRAEEALERYAARVQTLHTVDRAILAAESPEAIAEISLAHIRRVVPCTRASLALFDLERGDAFVLTAMVDDETRVSKGWHGPTEAEWPLKELEKGEIYVVEDVLSAEPMMPLYQTLQAEGVRSIVHLPLVAEGTLIGSLNLGLPVPGGLTAEQVDIAHEIASSLAVSIHQNRLHEQVQRHAEELELEVARRTAALQASEGRLRTIYEGAAIGIGLADMEGRMLDSNPALQAMLGYSGEELRGMVFSEFTHPEDAPAEMGLFQEMAAGKCRDYRMEKRYIRKDGGVIRVNLTVSLVRGSKGEPLYAIGMAEDVTERKQIQEALLNAEKLAVAGRLGASLAHEINNPLQSVIGCLGLAEKNLAEGGDVSRYLEVARNELRRAARIVSQLRDLGRLSTEEQKKSVDVNALVDEVLVLIREQAQERRIQVIWEPAEALPGVEAVADRMRQVFLNLVLNALDALGAGGQLRVSTARTEQPAGVRIVFADNGSGITSNVLSKLFDPFYTTKPGGLGLGLYITKSIVEEHGGRVDIATRPGEGTTFMVWLPA
jgi:PAS domain S-box-containing protein